MFSKKPRQYFQVSQQVTSQVKQTQIQKSENEICHI